MKRSNGFTLLEMVVAIGIFSVIATISYTSIDRFLDAREALKVRHDHLRLLQRTMGLLEMDMRFMVNRPVRDGFGDGEASLIALGNLALGEGELVRLTTSQPEPELPVSRLKRISWRLIDGDLQRVSWTVLDRDQDSQQYVVTLMRGVETATLSYYLYDQEENLQIETEWEEANGLPVGVEFALTLQNGRQYRRLITVLGSS